MGSYVTVADLREYLDQVKSEVDAPGTDAKLQNILNRAASICNDASVGLGFSFAMVGDDDYVTEARTVVFTHGPYMVLPPHRKGSITVITLDSSTIPSTEYAFDPDGTLRRVAGSQWPRQLRDDFGWQGYLYEVTADWGYGPPPDSLKEVCLEVAVNIWRAKDAGRFSNVVASQDGGPVGYEGALTPMQKSVLQGLKNIYSRGTVAV